MNPNKKASQILARRREKDKSDQEDRIKEVYQKIPTMESLDKNIKELGYTIIKENLKGKDSRNLEDELKKLREYKKSLLIENGFDNDYMEIRYFHEICKDTGFVGTKMCSCRKQIIIDENYS